MRLAVWRAACALAALCLASPSSAAGADSVQPSEAIRIALGTKEFSTAIAAMRTHAERGDRDAQYLLGLALLSGVGLNEDRVVGRSWLEKAANRDHPAACYALAGLLANPTPGDPVRDEAGAKQWLSKAAALGYSRALETQKQGGLPLSADYPDSSASKAVRFAFARWAIEAGREELLAGIDAKELVHDVDDFGRGLLGWAAVAGNLRATQLLVHDGAPVDAADSFGITPLMLATNHADTSVTTALLAAGASVERADKVQRTALTHAAWANQAKQIESLATARANLNHVDARGWTALDVAIQRNRAAAAAQLRELGAVANFGTGARVTLATGVDPTRTGTLYQGWAPLLVAVSRTDNALVKQLLESGADAKGVTPQGDSALHIAVEAKAVTLIGPLVAAGADPNLENKNRESALELAVRRGDATVVSTLLNASGKQDATRMLGAALAATRSGQAGVLRAILAMVNRGTWSSAPEMPAILAVRSGNMELARAWLEHGIDVNAAARDGRSALWIAARDGRLPLVTELLGAKANVEQADRGGATPLFAAASGGHPAVVKALLAAGAQVDARSREGTSVLAAAASGGHADVVRLLLAQQPTVDVTDQFGNTALLLAARAGHTPVCRLLLAAGASTRVRNSDRVSAVEMAEMRGDAALAQVLRDR